MRNRYTYRAFVVLGLLVAGVLFMPALASAAEFEVTYPALGGGVTPGGGPAQWVQYLFLFGIAVSSIAAVGSLIYAGIVWMTSGITGKQKDALERIKAALLGILVIASSVLILRIINPDLVSLQNPKVDESVFQNEALDFGKICTERDERTDNDCTQEGTYCNESIGKCLYGATGEGGVGTDCAGAAGGAAKCGEGLYCSDTFTCQRLPTCYSNDECPEGYECVGATAGNLAATRGQCQ